MVFLLCGHFLFWMRSLSKPPFLQNQTFRAFSTCWEFSFNGADAPLSRLESVSIPLQNSFISPLTAPFHAPIPMVQFHLSHDQNRCSLISKIPSLPACSHPFCSRLPILFLVLPIFFPFWCRQSPSLLRENSLFQPSSCSLTPPTWEDNSPARREPQSPTSFQHGQNSLFFEYSSHFVPIPLHSFSFTSKQSEGPSNVPVLVGSNYQIHPELCHNHMMS